MSGVKQGPRSSVFTTMRFSKSQGVFLLENHLNRLRLHADKLKIDTSKIDFDSILDLLQKNPPDLTEGLLRLECTSTLELRISYRSFSIQNEQVDAITVPSKVWPKRVAGTKHGEWKSYGDAREHAERHGADLALLIHNYSIIDCDRCTPLILDEDGVIWRSNSELSVDSITFELLEDELLIKGFFIQRGILNERLVARCVEAIAVGSGVNVLKIDSIDGEPIGNESSFLFEHCVSFLDGQYKNENLWTEVWE